MLPETIVVGKDVPVTDAKTDTKTDAIAETKTDTDPIDFCVRIVPFGVLCPNRLGRRDGSDTVTSGRGRVCLLYTSDAADE